LRHAASILGLIALGSGLVGCGQTGGIRVATPSDVKTTATVGDKTFTVVSGLPDDDYQVAETEPGIRRSGEARISGRVYDEYGEPVRDAVVRLGMSGAAGGKLVHANTDRSGAFTLRGVRPGSNYTVIAEYQDDRGAMTGRADAMAPDVGVRVDLHPRDARPGREGAIAAAPKQPRVSSVARAEGPDDAAFSDGYEDDEPRPPARSSRPIRPRLDAEPEGFDDEPIDEAPEPPPARESFDDDGENPLPPAREISKVSARDDDSSGHEAEAEPRNLPENLIGGGREPAEPPPANPSRQRRARPTWSDVASLDANVPFDEQVAQTSVVRDRVAAPSPEPGPAPAPRQLAKTSTTPLGRPAAPADIEARRRAPYCDYDVDQRRVTSFAMLDVSGRKVSLNDFDADLILLDFWGSWCAQCRPALEHAKELQAEFGGGKLQVVSVAYEKTPTAERVAKLADVVHTMRLNFPVLMTDFSDPCPIREALAIDVFPTMILLDREGRVLRRERGATPTTLANIDRAIADHLERQGHPRAARREVVGRTTR